MPNVSVFTERAMLAAALVLLAEPAYAYIDPGTGSVVTSAILGVFGAIAYTFRKYMYRLKDLFSRKSERPDVKREDGPVGR